MKMLKFFILVLTFICFFSCSNESVIDNQDFNFKAAPKSLISKIINTNLNSKVNSGPCDGASSYGISVQTDFDFKRPKHNCQSGFWFCTETSTYLQCLDSNGDVIYQVELFTGNREEPMNKYSIGLVELENNEIVLSFPKLYFENGNYTNDDLKFFSVDESIEILPNAYLVKGDFEVFSYEESLLVLLPITNE